MTTPNQTETSFSWIRKIPGELFRLDEKPLVGFPPEFSWTNFAAELKNVLQIETLSFEPSDWQWRSKEEFFAGIGDSPIATALAITPLTGSAWFVLSEKDLNALIGEVLAKQPDLIVNTDADIFSSLSRFIVIETINAFEKVCVDKKLVVNLSSEQTLPNAPCLTLDIAIKINDFRANGRLFLSTEFRKAWMERYLQEKSHLNLTSPLADTLEVLIHFEAGRLNLSQNEWKAVHPGDFLILDSCSLDADEDKGRILLTINGSPYFRGKIKQGSIKILEHPLYYEVNSSMDTPQKGKEDFEDFEIEDETPSTPSSADEDFDIEDEEIPSVSAKTTEEDLTHPAEEVEPSSEEPHTSQSPASLDEIPLPIIIEIGRIQMSIKKLLELQPGNMLELNVHPEQGVDLVVHGKKIARGELLKIGDSLGVRILEFT